jgi:hypothetical protein
MTSNADAGNRILGRLRSADGVGVVRIEDRYDTAIDDLWSALTDPARLARWHGQVEGDLRPGGAFRVYLARPTAASQRVEEGRDVARQRFRLFAGGEMSATGHRRPATDVVEAFDPLTRGMTLVGKLVGKDGDRGGHVDEIGGARRDTGPAVVEVVPHG